MEDKVRMINIFSNEDSYSREVRSKLKKKLEKSGFIVPKKFEPEAELVVVVGGDGAFLKTLHKYDFPNVPFIGINTGHLGFFQELHPDELDEFIFKYNLGKYEIQELATVKATAKTEKNEIFEYMGLNEIVIKGDQSLSTHLNISIGESFIERFSGDGILVATPAGSTAYNYALGGGIIDPRLNVLQITPIAPMNTTAYRSFTSSLMLPPDLSIRVYPENTAGKGTIIVSDGQQFKVGKISEITIAFSGRNVKMLRFEKYDFWAKVKSKFL